MRRDGCIDCENIGAHAATCPSRPGPGLKRLPPPRYGAWWNHRWFNHTRSGVTAYETVAELLEAVGKP